MGDPQQQDWFEQNAPRAAVPAPSAQSDWFAANAPTGLPTLTKEQAAAEVRNVATMGMNSTPSTGRTSTGPRYGLAAEAQPQSKPGIAGVAGDQNKTFVDLVDPEAKEFGGPIYTVNHPSFTQQEIASGANLVPRSAVPAIRQKLQFFADNPDLAKQQQDSEYNAWKYDNSVPMGERIQRRGSSHVRQVIEETNTLNATNNKWLEYAGEYGARGAEAGVSAAGFNNPTARGIARSVGKNVTQFVANPTTYATLAVGGAGGKVGQAALTGLFTAGAAKQSYDAAGQLGAIWDREDIPQDKKVELGTDLVLNTIMAGLAGAHTVKAPFMRGNESFLSSIPPEARQAVAERFNSLVQKTGGVLSKVGDVAAEVANTDRENVDVPPKPGALSLRNNPVVNTVLGPNPDLISPVDALTKATRPRNSIKDFSTHAERALPDARRAADALGIDPENMTIQDAERAVTQAKKDVWTEFEQQHLGPGGNIGVDATPVAQRINQVVDRMSEIQKRRTPQIVETAQNNAADYDGKTLTLNDIEDRIQELNNQLRTKQNTYKVNEQALRNDPEYAHQFAELDGLRQLERESFDKLTGPGSADLKRRYGSLKVLEDVLDRRIPVVERQNTSSLYETAGRIAGLGDMAAGVLARDVPRVVAGAVKMRAGQNAAMLNDPNFLIQQAFKKTTPSGPIPAAPEVIPPKGLLERGDIPLGMGEDTSGSVPYSPPPVAATSRAQRMGLILPENATPEPIRLGGPPDTSGSIPGAHVPPFNYTSRAQRKGLLLNAAPEEAPAPAPAPPNAEILQSIRQRSNLVYDPATRRMVRQYPVDSASNGGTIGKVEAQNAAGKANPGNTPESAAVPQPVQAGSPTAAGSETSIRVPGEDRSYAARYQVRELADIQPSHSGVTFQPNTKYALSNDRDYSNAVNQGKVITNSAPGKFDPSYHITDNPDATNGPIVIDSEGHALGGNGRAMILDRVYRYNPQGAAAYKDLLSKKAAQFGIDPAEIAKMKQPVLVREIDDAEFTKPEAKQNAVTDFNKKGTAELTPAERAITDSRRVSQKTLDSIAGKFDDRGPEATLADVLRGNSGTEILDRLINDGVITPQERAGLASKNELTEAGKERIGKLMVGRFFRDPMQIDSTPPAIRGKLERLAAPLARVDGLNEWDIAPRVQEAMDILEEANAHKASTIDDLLRQQGLFGGSARYSPEAVSLAKRLKNDSATSLVKAARQYAQDASDAQRTLLGPAITQEQAFKEAFGDKPPSSGPPGQPAIQSSNKPPEQGGFSLAHGPAGASAEELARGETFWRIKRNGQLSYQGVSPDANLSDGEALVAINKATGKMRVQEQRMGLNDEALLARFGGRVKAASRTQ